MKTFCARLKASAEQGVIGRIFIFGVIPLSLNSHFRIRH